MHIEAYLVNSLLKSTIMLINGRTFQYTALSFEGVGFSARIAFWKVTKSWFTLRSILNPDPVHVDAFVPWNTYAFYCVDIKLSSLVMTYMSQVIPIMKQSSRTYLNVTYRPLKHWWTWPPNLCKTENMLECDSLWWLCKD